MGIRRLNDIYLNKCSNKQPINSQQVNLVNLIAEYSDSLTENPAACDVHRQTMYDVFYKPLSNYGLF